MAKPSITRNEALERLREYHWISQHDPETAHICADEVLLEIVDDKEITEVYRSIRRLHG